MQTVRVFRSGNSQAVRIPKEFRVAGKELYIDRRGDEIVLREPPRDLSRAFDLLRGLPDDFMPSREDAPPQTREAFP